MPFLFEKNPFNERVYIAMLRIFSVSLIFSFIWFVCSCEERRQPQGGQAYADSLQTQLIVLNDSVNQAWEGLITSDQLREQSLKDLLEQISALPNHNKSLHDSLVKEQAGLSRIRYSSPPALTPAVIDTYDTESDKLKSRVYQLGNSTPGFAACVLCGELMENIEKADNQTLFNRINYDRHAMVYNAFIKKHATDLAAIKPAYENLSPLPLFQISSRNQD
jgi:hypothetical protein